ncbi:MAG: hypothetical protein M9921_10190 [Fimbriimonadaceae bacterium]|nr:hypothetical protein [Fimbriimonadaceae bacterium]
MKYLAAAVVIGCLVGVSCKSSDSRISEALVPLKPGASTQEAVTRALSELRQIDTDQLVFYLRSDVHLEFPQRLTVIEALGQRDWVAARPFVLADLKSTDRELRLGAVWLLSKFESSKENGDVLRPLVQDEDPAVRLRVKTHLLRFVRGNVLELETVLLPEGNEDVLDSLIRLISSEPELQQSVVPILRKILAQSPSLEVKRDVIDVLRARKPPGYQSLLDELNR